MTDRVAQLEAALRAENALIVEAQRLLTAYIQGSQRAPPLTASSSARARKTPCGLASGVIARRSKPVLSRLFRLKKELPGQIFGLMGS